VDKKQSRRAALGGSVELEEADGLGKAREVVVAVVVVKGEVRQEQQEQQQQQQTAAGG
jgi:membrane protein involved in colicin uptake